MATQLGRTLRIFVLALGLFRDYRRIRRITRRFEGALRSQRLAVAYARAGRRVRTAAFDLQGLIVKVGQFLSTRTDVLPTAFTGELRQLQDEVPASAFEPVRVLLEEELGGQIEDVFPVFDRASIASASLGQVYRAQLPDGTDVAVKVQRPGIERLARIDLSALRKVVAVLHRFTKFGRRMDVWQIYLEFREMVYKELDYVHEANNLKRFAQNASVQPRIVVPRVYEEVSTKRVLVMQFIEGAKATDVAALAAWGTDTAVVVEMLLDSYLRQVLETGLIHVDPHPGNLLVLQDGRLCFLDFGMMTDLPKADAKSFARLVQSLLQRDFAGAVTAVDELGFLQPHADRAFLQRALAFMLDSFNNVELHAGPELDAFLDEFNEFLRDEPIQIPAKYMFLGRALGMVIGLINTLAPSLEWGPLLRERALPFVARLGRDGGADTPRWLQPIAEWFEDAFGQAAAEGLKLVLNQAGGLARIGLRLPGRLDRTLDKLETGNLQVRLDLDDALSRMASMERLFARLTWLLFSIVTGLAAAWLQNRSWLWQADVAWILTGIGVVAWFGSWLRRSASRDRSRRAHRHGPVARHRHSVSRDHRQARQGRAAQTRLQPSRDASREASPTRTSAAVQSQGEDRVSGAETENR